MKLKNVFTLFSTAFAVGLIVLTFALPAQAALKAGAAKVEITPDYPVYLGGYFHIQAKSIGAKAIGVEHT